MSKISNKVIEAKLKAILDDHQDTDLSKFGDNQALTLIFGFYDDRHDFSEIIIDKQIHEIQELKLVELDLRTELEYYKKKEAERVQEEGGAGGMVASSRLIQENKTLQQRCQQLRRVCEQQQEVIAEHEKDQVMLQKKILQSSEQHNEVQKECADLRTQIEAQAAREKESELRFQQLIGEREALVKDYEEQISQYKGVFIEELNLKLSGKNSEELQQSRRVAEALQQELRQQEKLLKTVIGEVGQVFKLPPPPDLKDRAEKWVQELGRKMEEYRRTVKIVLEKDLRDVKDPLLQLADYEKKQVQSRNMMVKKYLLS